MIPHIQSRHTLSPLLRRGWGRFLLILLLVSCSTKQDPEVMGQRLLDDARFALRHQHYDEARDSILSLRAHYPRAIQARRQALLLLDSIEIQAAADSLAKADSADWERLDVKHKFFQRKLEEDLLQSKFTKK